MADTITIGDDEAEQRIDRWLRRRYDGLGQGQVEKMCRKGEVRVDGGRVKASTRVGPGQVVRVPPYIGNLQPREAEAQPAKPDEPQASPQLIEQLQQAVLFRDDHLLVLNKPAGVPVQGGSKLKSHIAGALEGLKFEREDAPRLIHRLDRDTSGLLVLARTGAAASTLGSMFRTRAVEKIYFAAVAGRPHPTVGTIRYGLVKQGSHGNEKMVAIHPDHVKGTEGAKPAITDFSVIEQAGGRMAWVAMRPITGRTHQLRVHMAELGCPIAGDGKYGSRSQENLGDGWGGGIGGALSRKLHLHAARLSFEHPVTGKPVRLRAPLPEHMLRTWEMMGWREEECPEEIFDV